MAHYLHMYNQIDSNKRKTTILMGVFVALITGIAWGVSYLYNYDVYSVVLMALIFSSFSAVFSLYFSDKVALKSTGAREINHNDNPYVMRMVENLCITAGMPMPKVHIIESPALNAFATGRDPEHASIALTTGIIQALENEELEGVIAHELSHVKNYDIRVMTVVIIMVGAIAILSDYFFRFRLFGGGDNRDKGGNGWFALAALALMVLSPIIAEVIKLAVSRKREYLADASGALLTRYPEGLARALEKIAGSSQPLAGANAATAHLFISEPAKRRLAGLFSTHPPIEDRIKKLRGMA